MAPVFQVFHGHFPLSKLHQLLWEYIWIVLISISYLVFTFSHLTQFKFFLRKKFPWEQYKRIFILYKISFIICTFQCWVIGPTLSPASASSSLTLLVWAMDFPHHHSFWGVVSSSSSCGITDSIILLSALLVFLSSTITVGTELCTFVLTLSFRDVISKRN